MKLFTIQKKEYIYYLLAAVLCLFNVMPVHIPNEVASLVDTLVGKVVVVVIALNLFFAHPVVGAIGIIAAYELIKRSEGKGSRVPAALKKYVPSEAKKTSNLSRVNQFPVTIEEIVIHNQIPYSFNLTNPTDRATYKPIQDSLHDAAKI